MKAQESVSTGSPAGERRQLSPSNLFRFLAAMIRPIPSWPSLRMLTQNRVPHSRSLAHEFDVRSGMNPTSGGSRETEVKDPMVMPTASPSGWIAVTTHTPVGYCPRTWRNRPAGTVAGTSYPCPPAVSPAVSCNGAALMITLLSSPGASREACVGQGTLLVRPHD